MVALRLGDELTAIVEIQAERSTVDNAFVVKGIENVRILITERIVRLKFSSVEAQTDKTASSDPFARLDHPKPCILELTRRA